MAIRHSFADIFGHNEQFEHIIFKSISSIAAYQSSYNKCSLNCSRGGWDHVMLQVELKQFRIVPVGSNGFRTFLAMSN